MPNLIALPTSGPGIARLEGIKKLHFIGIGGVGMSGIAQMCLEHGFAVSGSDSQLLLVAPWAVTVARHGGRDPHPEPVRGAEARDAAARGFRRRGGTG
jgi:hypothetical protein